MGTHINEESAVMIFWPFTKANNDCLKNNRGGLTSDPRPQLKAIYVTLALAAFVGGCEQGSVFYTGSSDYVEDRRQTLARSAKAVSEGKNGALFSLVERYRKNKDNSKNVNKYIDYHYMRNASEILLLRFYENALNKGDRVQAREHLSEALRISPKNKKIQALFSQISGKINGETDPFVYFPKISPTSDAASTYNSLFLRRARYHLGYHSKTVQSIDDFSNNDSALIRSRYSGLVENKRTLKVPRSETLASFAKNFHSRFGFKLVVHDGLKKAFRQKIKHSATRISPLNLLSSVAKRLKANFLLGSDSIYMFSGSDIPADLGGKTSAAYIKSENGEVSSLISALRAYGLGPQIAQVDAANKLIWLQCTYGEYVQAVITAASIDFPKAEIVLDVDIVEVQTTLVDQIGARIPQLIEFNVGDPTFTRYFVGQEATVNTVTNIATTGGAVLENLLNQTTPNVIRAVIRDPGAQLAARSSNFHVKLTSKPALRLRDGERARIQVGDRIPAFTTTASSTGFVSETVTYTDSGLKLDVDTNITSSSEVVIGLSLESNNFIREVRSQNGASAPQLSQRIASTRLSVQDGNTAYIGGLFSSDQRNDRTGVPGFGKTVLSFLGGTKEDRDSVIELMVFVTPTIVRPRTAPARHFVGNFRERDLSADNDNLSANAGTASGSTDRGGAPVQAPQQSNQPTSTTSSRRGG